MNLFSTKPLAGLFLLSLFAFIACRPGSSEISLTEKGVSRYRIIYGDQAPSDLVAAINKFREDIKVITGAELIALSDVVKEQPEEILIGASKRTTKYRDIPLQDLGSQGYFAGVRGKKWIILGNSNDAILYALRDIIQQTGSIKLEPGVTQYAKKPNLKIGAKDRIHIPSFSFRQCISPLAGDAEYRLWNFINIDGQNDWGTWGYSMERIFPASSYLTSNPNYFAVIDNKANSQQYNFSQPELLPALEKNLDLWNVTKGRAKYWSISPAENHMVSEDPGTVQSMTATGSSSGALLKLVNEIAQKNTSKTYAVWLDGPYRKPATSLELAKNIMLVLDTKDVNQAISLGESVWNESFRSDLAGWKKLTGNLAVVLHITNEKNFMMPYPNLQALKKSMNYLHNQGVDKVIFSGMSNPGTPMADLKFYVASQLAWNVNANVDTLIWNYCENTFGQGAKAMAGYVQALEKSVQAYQYKLSYDGHPAQAYKSWLAPNNINQLYSYFNGLTTLIQRNSELKEKVDKERLSLIYAQLSVAQSMGTNTYGYFMNLGALRATLVRQDNPVVKTGEEKFNLKAKEWSTIQGMRDLLNQFVGDCAAYNIRTIDNAGATPGDFRDMILKYLDQPVQTHGGFKKGKITFNSNPDPGYGDVNGALLHDGVQGLLEHLFANWLGLQGGKAEMTWDLEKDTSVASIQLRFLQHKMARAYIPSEVTLAVSVDGMSFKNMATKSLQEVPDKTVQSVTFSLDRSKIKALKFYFKSKEKCPADHPMAGSNTSILMDEIVLN
jgi:hypothetical protein